MTLTFFIIIICFIFSINTKNVLAESNTKTSKSDPSNYFYWKNDWQNNNRVSISVEAHMDPIVGEYNYRLSRSFSFDLLEGDTKPMVITGTDIFYLMTPIEDMNTPTMLIGKIYLIIQMENLLPVLTIGPTYTIGQDGQGQK
jgi:hypothetical protein